jgi:tetratricopeptide (TPR) repeat protein
VSVALCASVVVTSGVAFGQDIAAAEALFREGRELMDKGDYTAACAKLAQSQRLDASSGTLLNLAMCHEKQGKNATAWAEFLAAARLAASQNKADRADEAKQRAAELEPKLTYLTIVVAQPVDGLEIRRDDVKLDASAEGS